MSLMLMAREGSIATLTLNRPENLNALSPEMFEELNLRLDELEAAKLDVNCVVVRGAGRSFCAGADLKALKEGHSFADPDYRSKTIERLACLPMPVVASVHGHCYTGGLELALAADIIVAAENAVFCDTHARLGIVPRWGLSVRLARRVGVSTAKLISLTCAPISGHEALRLGLCDACAPEAELEKLTAGMAGQIASQSRKSLVAIKHLYEAGFDMPIGDALCYERAYKT